MLNVLSLSIEKSKPPNSIVSQLFTHCYTYRINCLSTILKSTKQFATRSIITHYKLKY